MSTRCNIHFTYKGKVEANIYRHYDGGPDEVFPDLEKFLAAVEQQARADTRFGDPSYLAAKFVVWQAGEYASDPLRPLAFTGVGVDTTDAGDGEYVYTVECGTRGESGRPEVTVRRA